MFEGTWWGHSGQPVAANDAICCSTFPCKLSQTLVGTMAELQRVTGVERWLRQLLLVPGLGSPHLPTPAPQAWLCPGPVASGKERALSTSYFPVGLYFSFHHLLTLDVEIRAGVHRAEKVLSIFFPSCRHQKGMVGSIAFYITGGFDPLSIEDINLPLYSLFGC